MVFLLLEVMFTFLGELTIVSSYDDVVVIPEMSKLLLFLID